MVIKRVGTFPSPRNSGSKGVEGPTCTFPSRKAPSGNPSKSRTGITSAPTWVSQRMSEWIGTMAEYRRAEDSLYPSSVSTGMPGPPSDFPPLEL